MNLSRFDLNLLVLFDTIYREGSLTRASQHLHLSQPAISHALGRLREALNDPLFVRQGSGMAPTPLARSLIGPVRQALQSLAVCLSEHGEFNPAQTRRSFTLGLRDVLEATALPPLLAQLQQAAPLIDVASVRIERKELETELASGRIDLAVDVPMPVSDAIRQRRLFRDRLTVVARAGHPAIGGRLDLATYLAQSHALVSSRRSGPGLEDFELNQRGLRRRIALRCQHYFAACRVVSHSDLLLTMPEQYARLANAHFGNQLHPFPLDMPPLDVHLYWHANTEHDPASLWLRQQMTALFQQLEDGQ